MIIRLVYVAIAALLAAIVLANLYTILHAWRSDLLGWATVLLVLLSHSRIM